MMTEIQKQDLQFWFYNGIYVDKVTLQEALQKAVKVVDVTFDEGESYLRIDGRLKEGELTLREYSPSPEEDRGEYLDFDWMAEILIHQGKLQGESLHRALGIIFKLSPVDAAEVLSQMNLTKDDEGEED